MVIAYQVGYSSFYLLFCLDIKGIEHLCTGKNLSIITKIFSTPKNSHKLLCDEKNFEFLYLLIKGVYLYNLDLSNDKCIYKLTKILDLIQNVDNQNKNESFLLLDEIPFKSKERLCYIEIIYLLFFIKVI